ncbi:MAG TPA: hypothetical protein VMP03_11410, partial [Methylomirabilota bacterium]|nr:hypothetical protein [Methylomirabilota bacterium]
MTVVGMSDPAAVVRPSARALSRRSDRPRPNDGTAPRPEPEATMTKMIFLNLPVRDLPAATAVYEA